MLTFRKLPLGRGLRAALGRAALRLFGALVLVQTRPARRVHQRLDAPVEAEAAAVEDDLLDARGDFALCNRAPHPLRGLSYDSSYLADFLSTISGPVVLVGHSYGGMVITNAATGNANVKALVFDDAYIPAAKDTLLGLTGAEPGAPVTFLPKFIPPSGTTIKISLEYQDNGKSVRRPAQDWIRDVKTKKALASDWVFAGSRLFKDPLNPAGPPEYLANSGDVICIANFDTALLDLPIDSTKDNENLSFEANTDAIPALETPVTLILEPVLAKKKASSPRGSRAASASASIPLSAE